MYLASYFIVIVLIMKTEKIHLIAGRIRQFTILACIILIFFFDFLKAQDSPYNFLNERLNYRLKYMNMKSGVMNFQILERTSIDSLEVYHLQVHAKTRGVFSSLFKVDNTYQSYFSTKTFLPRCVKKQIRQKNIENSIQILYNQDTHIASINDSTSWEIPQATYGFFSMFYLLRNHDFIQNDTLTFYLDSENQPSKVIAYLVKKEKISIKTGTYNALKLRLSFIPLSEKRRIWKTDLLTNRLAKPNSVMTMWISGDRAHIPLKVQFHQKPFDIKMVLDRIDQRSFE